MMLHTVNAQDYINSYVWLTYILLLLSIRSLREKNIFVVKNDLKPKILFLSDDGMPSSETESDVKVEESRISEVYFL